MADLRKEGLNNMKRGVSVFVSDTLSTAVGQDDTLVNIPANSLVTDIRVMVTTASGTATDTVDIKADADVIADEVVVGTTGAKKTAVDTFYPTGTVLSVVSGADAPDTAGRYRIVVEYVELDKRIGEYTA